MTPAPEIDMFQLRYVAIPLLATIPIAHAQQVPSAGSQLQQLPQAPVPQKSVPDVDINRPATTTDSSDAGPAISVVSLNIVGQTAFPKSDLLTATGFTPGSMLTLSQLRALAGRISAYYHARGYFLAQAYLPAQGVQDGVVTIQVIEGRYGAITVREGAPVSAAVPRRLLSGLGAGDLIANAPLERRLLLLSDIPGVRVRATLVPGAAVGTSDLVVDLTRAPLISGNIEADNAGSRYTGSYRLGGTINVNNPGGYGDQLSVRVLASNTGLAYGRASYQAPIGALTLGVAYAHLHYTLGREFDVLNGSGTADIFSGYASYPLIRSRRANLYALGGVDYKLLRDKLGLVATNSDKRVTVGTIGLSGDARDQLGGGGSTVFSLGLTRGTLAIRSPAERAVDRTTARSAGGFSKIWGSVARLQSVAGPLSLYATARGQVAFDNLDSSEKIELGGAYGVRAYPEGEAFGDTGYVATAEARVAIGGTPAKMPGSFELVGFVDTGEVRYAQSPWFAGSNHASRSGYGVGINWSGPQGLLIKASYARKLGTPPATSAPDKDGRLWIQLVKLF